MVFEGREEEIANIVGNILLDIIPDTAVSITAKSEVGEDWSDTGLEFENAAGTAGRFDADHFPKAAVRDINRALVDFREVFAAGGGEPWNRSTFTVYRDGRFNVNFAYEADEGQ